VPLVVRGQFGLGQLLPQAQIFSLKFPDQLIFFHSIRDGPIDGVVNALNKVAALGSHARFPCLAIWDYGEIVGGANRPYIFVQTTGSDRPAQGPLGFSHLGSQTGPLTPPAQVNPAYLIAGLVSNNDFVGANFFSPLFA
jgi:hypothetical protein